MDKFSKSLTFIFIWLSVLLFIIFYPMLISIYVFLPLLIGVMGYIFMQGIEKEKVHYIFISIIYIINLEINLSLPIFLIFISLLLVYIFLYPSLRYFHECVICKPVLSILLIDTVYLVLLLSYDFIFQTNSIVLDSILIYSIIVDMLVMVIL